MLGGNWSFCGRAPIDFQIGEAKYYSHNPCQLSIFMLCKVFPSCRRWVAVGAITELSVQWAQGDDGVAVSTQAAADATALVGELNVDPDERPLAPSMRPTLMKSIRVL